jgi:hypothetical protein
LNGKWLSRSGHHYSTAGQGTQHGSRIETIIYFDADRGKQACFYELLVNVADSSPRPSVLVIGTGPIPGHPRIRCECPPDVTFPDRTCQREQRAEGTALDILALLTPRLITKPAVSDGARWSLSRISSPIA